MLTPIPLLLLAFTTLISAEDRIFSFDDSDCSACLAKAEDICPGFINADDYTECFCKLTGDAYSIIDDCVRDDKAACFEQQHDVLFYYGSHCSSRVDAFEKELCVTTSADDELLLDMADTFCEEFRTVSGSQAPTSTSQTPETTTVAPVTTSTSPKTTSSPSPSTEEQSATTVEPSTSTSQELTDAPASETPSATESAPSSTPTNGAAAATPVGLLALAFAAAIL